jgi:hypothetical protein
MSKSGNIQQKITKTFTVYENERWYIVNSWQKNLLKYERPAYSDLDGHKMKPMTKITLPDDKWAWEKDW